MKTTKDIYHCCTSEKPTSPLQESKPPPYPWGILGLSTQRLLGPVLNGNSHSRHIRQMFSKQIDIDM